MAESKSHSYSPLPRLPRWWQFGGRVPANPDYSIPTEYNAPVDEPPKAWPGSQGEWKVYRQLAVPRLPVSYDRKPRPQLHGAKATILVGTKLINVGSYNPLERAALQGQGYSVSELTERQAQRWQKAPK